MKFPDLVNPYAYAMSLRRLMYKKGIFKSERVSVPVISIGNLSVGGTGKTPVTLYIAKYCIETLRKKTAIILRGYKRRSSGYLLVGDGKTIIENVARSGDEAQLYSQELANALVICDEDRIRGAKNAEALGAEIILLDDAYQHLRIKRDLNILLINSEEDIPTVMPFGRGRETVSAIRDADIIIETDSMREKIQFAEKPSLKARTAIGFISLYGSNREDMTSTEILEGKKILAFSGIANPYRFKNLLDQLVLSILMIPLNDHAEYTSETLEKIIATAKSEHCDLLATTTKDAVKMLEMYKALLEKDSSIPPLAVVHTEIEFMSGEGLLLQKINELFKK